MKLCAISFKECWRGPSGAWFSSGGFPLQMAAIGALFDEMTLLIVESSSQPGGIPLPQHASVIPLPKPKGSDGRRKLSVLTSLPTYWRRMSQYCRAADVVHVPLPGDLPFLGLLTALRLGKRVIARYGSSWSVTTETTWMNRTTRAWMRACAGGRNVMLATGEGERPPASGMSWIFATALSQRELEEINPNLDRDLSEPVRPVYAGRLSPEKGVANLIRALAVLKREAWHPMPLVTLAGDGPERGALERMTRDFECECYVRFAGQLDRPKLSQLLLQSDFCVQPSLTEGYSKAWLDALAHGLPVLASEVGAARGVIGGDGERGWLVPPGDVPALAETLKRIIRVKKDWPALRRRCRSFVQGRTLEAWGREIGTICARQWDLRLVEGKLQ